MSGFLLDSNIVSYLADQSAPQDAAVTARFGAVPETAEVAVSILTVYETAFVASSLPAFAEMPKLLRSILVIRPLPAEGVEHFVKLKVGLAGRWGVAPRALTRHSVDLMIAATALALDLVLVSGDSILRDLSAIEPRLTVEDWTA